MLLDINIADGSMNYQKVDHIQVKDDIKKRAVLTWQKIIKYGEPKQRPTFRNGPMRANKKKNTKKKYENFEL